MSTGAESRGCPQGAPVVGAALVTGAASGIGAATVRRLLLAGWSVLCADLNEKTGRALADELADEHPRRVAFVVADVCSEPDVEAAVRTAVEHFGRLDFVVNNAGIGGAFGPITELEVADWDYTFAVLVRGVLLGIKHGARTMISQGCGGTIVNVASIAGLTGGVGPQAYSAAKAAVISLTASAATELAVHRIRVNAVCPGIIATPLVLGGGRAPEAVIGGAQPWPELGRPDDVAAVIEFLAGHAAAFITGESVSVDGGLRAAGARLGDCIGGDPAARGLVGVNRGTTGLASLVRRRLESERSDST